MKIQGPGKTSSTGKTSKTKKTGDGSFGQMVSGAAGAGDAPEVASLSGMTATANLGALLNAQEAGDSTSEEAKARAKKRAEDLLDQLDELRVGMLNGVIQRQTLTAMSKMIADKRDEIDDPTLGDLLDHIDLRAQVELAKLERV